MKWNDLSRLTRQNIFYFAFSAVFSSLTQASFADKNYSAERASIHLSNSWSAPTSIELLGYLELWDQFQALDEINQIQPEQYKNLDLKDEEAIRYELKQKNLSNQDITYLQLQLFVHHYKNFRDKYEQSVTEYEKSYGDWLDDHIFKKIDQPTPDKKLWKHKLNLAIQSLRELFNRTPYVANNQFITLKIAMSQLLAGNENARLYFDKLIQHPEKEMIKEISYLGLGEYYFSDDNFSRSSHYYSLAFKSNRPVIKEYASYKLAWLLINAQSEKPVDEQNFDKSIAIFKSILNSKERDKFYGSKSFAYLKQRVKEDLVWALSEKQKSRTARDIFYTNKDDKDYYWCTMERITWIHEQNNDLENMTKVASTLFEQNPAWQNNIHLHLRLAKLAFENKKPLMVKDQAIQIHKAVTDSKHPWFLKHKKNTILFKYAYNQSFFLQYANGIFYEKKYNETKNIDYLVAANTLYGLFLLQFPKAKENLEVKFYFARTLEILGKDDLAVKYYHMVAIAEKFNMEHKRIASETMIRLQQNLSKEDLTIVNSAKTPANKKIPEYLQTMISVADTFIANYPKDEQSSKLSLQNAKIYFSYGQVGPSLVRFDQTINIYPERAESGEIPFLVLNYFNKGKDWSQLITWSEKFLKFDRQLDAKINYFVLQNLRTGLWEHAMAFKKAGDHKNAAYAFQRYQKRLPKDKRADLALVNAMGELFEMKRAHSGIEVGFELIEAYPTSEYAANTMFAITKAQNALGQYRHSAETMELFANTYPNDHRSPNLLVEASEIYRGLKNLDRSAMLLELSSTRYPETNLNHKSLLESAEIHLKLGQTNKAALLYRTYSEKFAKIDPEVTMLAKTKFITLTTPYLIESLNQKNIQDLEETFTKNHRRWSKDARNALSEYYFNIIHNAGETFKRQNVAYYDFNQYEQSINDYLYNLNNIEQLVGRLLAFGSYSTVTEGSYRMGLIYESALDSFRKKWNMDGLKADEANRILNAKEVQVIQLEKKLEDAYLQAYNNAKEHQVFTSYRNDALHKLKGINPNKYKNLDKILGRR